ncbi:MAG: hypothetical protein WD875_04730, partial [Pirellulales bacterium]
AVLPDTDFELPRSPPPFPPRPTPLHASGESGAPADAPVLPTRARFETVDAPATGRPRRPWWHIALAALPTAVALAALVALIVYLVRGPSIDERFAAIEIVAASDDPALLADREREIDRLIADMDESDGRIDTLREYQSVVELWRIERRLVRDMPAALRNAGRTPAERMLADALRTAESDPERAMKLLETIIALYDVPQGENAQQEAHSRHVVTIARRNLARVVPLVQRQHADQRAVISDALARADGLDETDPAAARRIREALVRQYGDERWAERLIQRARDRLEAERAEKSACSAIHNV